MSSQISIELISGPSKSTGSLRPIVAQATGRYDVTMKVQRSHAVIEPGMFLSTRDASPTYLPPQWSASVHPEGKIYFYRDSGLRIVTDSYLYTPEVGEQICAWAHEVEKQAADKSFVLTDSVELFLQLEDDDCNYYFVDRATQTLFWLEEYETSDLGLHPVVSPSHLKLVLETQYWSHVENFCMHFGGLPRKSIDDLILVFSHALADTLTSNLSTFPYDASTCEKFLNLLTSSRDRIHDGHTVCFVARLWGVIIYNRYETHYGQQQPRLSRDSSILVDQDKEIQWTKSIFSSLSFGTSAPYLKQLDELFLDRFVYGADWDSFMTQCIKGWQKITVQSVGLLLLHGFCFLLPVSPLLAYISASMTSLSILASALLIHRHEELATAGASPAHEYLTAVSSPRIKFQGVAFAFALPKTFFILGLVVFFSQWSILLCQNMCLTRAILCLGAVFVILIAIQFSTSRKSLFSRSEKDEASMV
ncbi:hypothetical protein GALMADRAFT_242345 [Galerina marginata CBS 339.88]|uniref:WW domain-containing protein n=1 Tax=Galerina marginata (strain CBS 339.88) TaxID=685588 RepID=A0A067TMB9_GALM3|nr:hypothetical protein GALMADRAFT_242345 [Galerina marginata CBS 339.88]